MYILCWRQWIGRFNFDTGCESRALFPPECYRRIAEHPPPLFKPMVAAEKSAAGIAHIATRCLDARAPDIAGHPNTFKPHTGMKTSVLFMQKWNDDPGAGPLCLQAEG